MRIKKTNIRNSRTLFKQKMHDQNQNAFPSINRTAINENTLEAEFVLLLLY